MTPPMRRENGYRTYTQQHLNELTLLRQARQVGFYLEESGELVNLFNDPQRHSADVKRRTLEKVAENEQHIEEKITGLTSKAIRFYEEKGLVTPPMRSENGYRTYTQQHLNELTLLRQARQVGFNLEESGELVNLFNDPQRHSADVKRRTLEKVAEIEQHIEELQSMRNQLLALANACPGDDSADCPIIENLSGCCHHRAG